MGVLTAGYGLLFNMPGYGNVSVGHAGGMAAGARGAVARLLGHRPAGGRNAPGVADLFQYADATGYAPPMPEALSFWQSRNRYKSSEIALSIADR